MTTATQLTVAVWPGTVPRLLRLTEDHEDYAEYVHAGGYQILDDPDGLLDEVDRSGLLGRGGAAFPLAVKLRTVRDAGRNDRDTVVVANGEEGEPASVKDKWLLRNRPHLVLDGVRLAAQIVGARRAFVYVSDAQAARAVGEAVEMRRAKDALAVTVGTLDAGYVAGEETAAVRALNGGAPQPPHKPPPPLRPRGGRGPPPG